MNMWLIVLICSLAGFFLFGGIGAFAVVSSTQGEVLVTGDASESITFEGEWYISNAVPYAEYVAYNYKPSAKAQKDWFTSIANQSNNVFTRQYDKVKP
ncbi:MAG: hypothetical protein VW945_05440 [Candidatus Poseidoniales archaeon]